MTRGSPGPDPGARTAPPPSPASAGVSRREVMALLGVGLAIAAITTAIAVLSGRRPATADPVLETPRQLADFQLTERSGRPVTRADLDRRFLVVNFVFTSCSVSCLDVNRRMAEIQRLVTGEDDVRLVSLTVDPRTDTPAVLTRFASRFGADAERWLFLTGDKTVLYPLIETSFLGRDPQPGPAAMPGGFRHTDRILLVDRAGHVRASFDGLARGTPHALVQAIRRLRAEPTPP